MKRIVRHRPSPAMIIACIALFAALGGTAFAAATLSGAKHHAKRLNGNKIKKASTPGNRVKADSLTGTQINESTLGTVPSAAVANQVLNTTRFYVKLGFGQSQDIVKAGSFTFTAKCLQNTTDDNATPNQDVARILISTSVNGMLFDGFDSKRGANATDFLEIATPETDRVFTEFAVPTGTASYEGEANSDGAAFDPNGVAVSFNQDGLGLGLNVYGPGCFFHGFATVEG